MAVDNPFEIRAVEIAQREVANLIKIIEELKHLGFPNDGPRQLIDLIARVADHVVPEIENQRVKSKTWPLEARPAASLTPLQLLGVLHNLLAYIEGTETQNNPYGIVNPLVDILGQIVPEPAVAIKPQWEFMYSSTELSGYLGEILQGFLPQQANELLEKFPQNFVVLQYPFSHRSDILMYTIMGHELGHTFDRVKGVSNETLTHINSSRYGLEKLIEEQARQDISKESYGVLYEATVEEHKASLIEHYLSDSLLNWLNEVVCDYFALQVFGPAFFFSATRFFSEVTSLDKWNEEYPTPRFRIKLMIDYLKKQGYWSQVTGQAAAELNEWDILAQSQIPVSNEPEEKIRVALEKCIEDVTPFVSRQVGKFCRGYAYTANTYKKEVSILVKDMKRLVPPIERMDGAKKETTPASIASILNAGWLCYLNELDDIAKAAGYSVEDRMAQPFNILNDFVARAIELNPLCRKFQPKAGDERDHPPASPFTDRIFGVVKTADGTKLEQLVITPILRKRDQIHHFAVDVRLSGEFIVPVRTKFPAIDVNPRGSFAHAQPEQYQEKTYRGFGGKDNYFVLHPNQLVLGSTLEYIKIPSDLMVYVIGRSSLGRLGLIVATATAAAPGYAGCLTLELVNLGDTPIILYPGQRIAQLQFHQQEPTPQRYTQSASSKYRCPVAPEFSKIRGDKDWDEELFSD